MRIVSLALAAVLWVASALAWPSLPDPMPSRVSAGEVTAWSAKTPLDWYLLPVIATVSLLLIRLLMRVARRRPALLNLPGKEQLLALPAERQAPVIDRTVELVDGTLAMTMLILGAAQYGRWHVAQGGSSDMVLVIVLPLAFLSTPLVLGLWLPRISSELDRQVKAHRAAGGTVPG